nr:hypothetical protein [Tanacetum cinerariifolium]
MSPDTSLCGVLKAWSLSRKVKDNKEKDKIRAKPDKIKSKREAWKSPEPSPTKSKPSQSQESIKSSLRFYFIPARDKPRWENDPGKLGAAPDSLRAWNRISKIKDAFGNKQYKPEDIQELIRKLFNDVQIIHEELAEYINTLSWNRHAFYNYDDDDDDGDYTIAIILVLLTEEPVDFLIMEDEHLDTIPATKLNEVIKSSVEDLVSIPSESEGIPDNMCDVPFCDNSQPLDISKDQFEDFSDSNDDSTSIDDDYFSIDNINYVEASPPDSELVSLEEVKDDIVREKLLNIHLFISKIESFNDNPTPDRLLKSPSLFPIPVEDSDSFFEKSNTSLSYLDNSLPEFETFSDHTKETSSGSTTTHVDNCLPEYDLFLFEIEPDQGELTSVVMKDNLGEPRVHVPNVLPTHPTLMLDSDFIPSD